MRYTPFIKTAGRGSAYCTRGGGYSIIKTGSRWHLFQMGSAAEGRKHETVGMFSSLGDAVTYYRREISRTIRTTPVMPD